MEWLAARWSEIQSELRPVVELVAAAAVAAVVVVAAVELVAVAVVAVLV